MKHSHVVVCLAIVGVLALASPARAVTRLLIDNQVLKAGQSGLEIFVKLDNDDPVYAVSISIKFNPAFLVVTGIEPAGVLASPGWEPGAGTTDDLVDNVRGEIIAGFVTDFDLTGPISGDTVIDPGTNQVVAKITLDTKAVDLNTTVLDLADGLGTLDFGSLNAVVALQTDQIVTFSAGSATNKLLLTDGTLTIDPFKPIIQTLTGNSGEEGKVFQVVGKNFDKPGLQVSVCDRPAVFSPRPDGQTLDITAPSCITCPDNEPCAVDVEICNENGCDTEAGGFTYLPPPLPIIRDLSLNSGSAGTTFFVTGENFSEPDLTVTVCGLAVTPTVLGDTQLQIVAPDCAQAGWAALEICNVHGCDLEGQGFFYPTVGDPPEITSIPEGNRGEAGKIFFVSGRNFSKPGLTVTLCDAPATFNVFSDSTIQVTAPECDTVGWSLIDICNPDGCAKEENGFFYEEIIVPGTPFVRGNANGDAEVDITDAIVILEDQFLGVTAAAECRDALDGNDDGLIDITDPIYLLEWQFLGNPEPPPPFPLPGPDPTPDNIPDC